MVVFVRIVVVWPAVQRELLLSWLIVDLLVVLVVLAKGKKG
jgi:hypothetical protein